jgi:hypothetical protein
MACCGRSFVERRLPTPLVLATVVLLARVPAAGAQVIYFNDFNGPPGSSYPEWTSSPITYASTANPPGAGTLPPAVVTNVQSPNGTQRFLGEFGGPTIGQTSDPGYNHTRVDQTITLTLNNLPRHSALQVAFDLYILKSWDGNSPAYGADRLSLSVAGGPTLFDTTFSNNPKIATDGSYQDYPLLHSLPQAGASAVNSFGYSFFGDSTYWLDFTFAHSSSTVTLDFRSSLFEGKVTDDESWGLDNVRVSIVPEPSSLWLSGMGVAYIASTTIRRCCSQLRSANTAWRAAETMPAAWSNNGIIPAARRPHRLIRRR